MSSVIIFYWTKAIFLSAWVGLIAANPVDYPSEMLTYEDGRTPDGFLARGPSSRPPSRLRRAPWAPSLTRPESYFRKAMDIMERAGSKRSVALPLRDFVNVLKHWNQRRDGDGEPVDAGFGEPVDAGFGEPADDANFGRNYEIFAADEEVSPEAFGRWRQDPRRGYEGVVRVRIEGGEGGDREGKRGGGGGAQEGRPLYIGFGQHAANAAIDAFEGILDEGKNEKQEQRQQNPVRFLGRRR